VEPVAVAAPVTVASQQAQQSALVSLLSEPLNAAWATYLDVNDATTIPQYLEAVHALTRSFGLISANEAAKSYVAARQAAGIGGGFRVPIAAPANAGKVDASVRWALSDLWTGQTDETITKKKVLGVTQKNVLDAGRQTVLKGVQADHKAHGWARETTPGCCSFCALLATRGAVYRSEQSSSFESHDHCHCFAVPSFTSYEPTAQVREWQQLYTDSTKGVRGSANMRKAFRQAYEAKFNIPS
jgi:hypothetical protein